MIQEQLLSMVSQRYDELQVLNKLDDFYDFEVQFAGIMERVGQISFRKQHAPPWRVAMKLSII